MMALVTRIAPDAFTCVLYTVNGLSSHVVYEATRASYPRAISAALAGAGITAVIASSESLEGGKRVRVQLTDVRMQLATQVRS